MSIFLADDLPKNALMANITDTDHTEQFGLGSSVCAGISVQIFRVSMLLFVTA